MNTRDYRTELKALKGKLDGLCTKRTVAAGGWALLKIPELVIRRPLKARQSLDQSIARWDRQFEEINAVHGSILAEAEAVEREEGILVRCAKCGTLCRSRFGGQLDSASLNLLGWDDPLAVQGWQCSGCLDPSLKRVEAIAFWSGSFAGITRGKFLPGYRVIDDKGLICSTQEHETEGEVKEELTLQAARKGSNACVFYKGDAVRDQVVAGHGPKGNPYYRTEVTFSGTARAVVVEPESVYGHSGKSHG